MNKSLIETVIDEERGIEYTFIATFGFLRNLVDNGFQLGLFYSRLSKGNVEVVEVCKALQCSLTKVGDVDINYKSAEKHIIEIVERFGVLEVNALLYDLTTRAMIGDIKKQQATQEDRKKVIKEMIASLFPAMSSPNFMKVGSLWVAISMISGVVGGVITKLF